MKEPILITGGCGFIGRHTAEALHDRGHQPVLLDDLSARWSGPSNRYPEFVGDITDATLVRDIIRSFGIKRVLHLAGKTSVAESERVPLTYWQENVIKTQRFLDAVGDVDRFVFASTCAVYAGTGTHFEDNDVNPTSHYGESKAWAEQIVRRAGGINLRYFNVTGGKPLDQRRFLGVVSRIGMTPDLAVPLRGSGKMIRDYIDVSDVALANMKALFEDELPAMINIGTGVGYSGRDVISMVERETGHKIHCDLNISLPGEQRAVIAGRSTEFIDWLPKSLEEIVRHSFGEHREVAA